ncbi:MAG: DNA replication and repair protein RecF [Chloroflexi bacterium]|nr:DNA replication and repair protein RecF [Chloroflexota bacterium]
MRVDHLSLTNFRNFVRLETALPAGALILAGANAQGKTSLLEALYLFTSAASPFADSDRQVINFLAMREAQPVARLLAEVRNRRGPVRLEVRLLFEPLAGGEVRFRKEVLINGVRRKPAELAAHFNAVLFLPQELRVVEGAPAERRRHVDELLAQVDSHYVAALSDYQRVLTQRNALLRQLQERGGEAGQLDFWDEQLAASGATISLARSLALAELERTAQPVHRRLTRQTEALQLAYRPSIDPAAPEADRGNGALQRELPLPVAVDRGRFALEDYRLLFAQRLRDSRSDSIARGTTLCGPHRDEWRLLINGIDLGTYGSRGQARTGLLALKLAEVEWIRARVGEWPVLLLDEVLSELDRTRRADLLEHLGSAEQAVLTTSDPEMLPASFRSQAPTWRLEAGTLRPE